MRACGISLYRTALPLVVFALAASAFLFALEERVLATANRRADQLNHLIRTGSPQTFDVLNRKWIVGHERRDLSLPVLRPAPARAERPVGVRVRSDGRTRSSRGAFVQRATYDRGRASRRRDRNGRSNQGWVARVRPGNAGQQLHAVRPIERRRFEPADYFVTEAPRARADELRAAARLHQRAARPAATTCSNTRSGCTARSRSRS